MEKATRAWHYQGTQQKKEHLQSAQTTVTEWQSAKLTEQAPGTIEQAAHDSSRIAPTSTAALCATLTQQGNGKSPLS